MKMHYQPGKWFIKLYPESTPKADENKEHLGFLHEKLEQKKSMNFSF